MKVAVAIVCSCLGFALTVVLLTYLAPPPTDPAYAVDDLRRDCEVLLVGPSYVRIVKTKQIDEAAARAGRNIRFCKFSLTALSGFEQKLALERILEQPWKKLRLVVVDVTLNSNSAFHEQNRFNPRVVHWHTADFLPWLQTHPAGQREQPREFPQFLDHVLHVGAHVFLVGNGAEHLAWSNPGLGKAPTAWTPKKDKRKSAASAERVRKNVKNLLKDLRATSSNAEEVVERGRWARELRELVRKHGLEAHALIAPVWRASFISEQETTGEDPLVVHDFCDPKRFPALYEHSARGRGDHLSEKGNKHYAKLLAHALMPYVENGK